MGFFSNFTKGALGAGAGFLTGGPVGAVLGAGSAALGGGAPTSSSRTSLDLAPWLGGEENAVGAADSKINALLNGLGPTERQALIDKLRTAFIGSASRQANEARTAEVGRNSLLAARTGRAGSTANAFENALGTRNFENVMADIGFKGEQYGRQGAIEEENQALRELQAALGVRSNLWDTRLNRSGRTTTGSTSDTFASDLMAGAGSALGNPYSWFNLKGPSSLGGGGTLDLLKQLQGKGA